MPENICDNLAESDRDLMIDKAAQAIVGRRLEAPAILFLEMHKPLSFLAGQAVFVGMPLAAPLFGFENVMNVGKLLSDRSNIELLIRRIEQLAADVSADGANE